jgi:hypothetical protein
MLRKSPDRAQADVFKNLPAHQLNPKHPLYLLGRAMPWEKLEEDFAPLYGTVGLPGHPMRTIAALLMLKHPYNLSDKSCSSPCGKRTPTTSTWSERLPSSGANPVLLVV